MDAVPGASLVAQLVKNPPAMQETPVHFLGQEYPRGEGIGYSLQYSWTSLVAQLAKNRPAMRETWFSPWVGKIPWRRAWKPTLVFLSGESPWTEEPGGLQSMGLQRVGHDWATKHTHIWCPWGCLSDKRHILHGNAAVWYMLIISNIICCWFSKIIVWQFDQRDSGMMSWFSLRIKQKWNQHRVIIINKSILHVQMTRVPLGTGYVLQVIGSLALSH